MVEVRITALAGATVTFSSMSMITMSGLKPT
jgi:hypothetical protein